MALALGLVVAATLFASVLTEGSDLATRPRQGRVDLPAHPLYASLASENRRVLTLGEGDELPNYVYEDDADDEAVATEDIVGAFGDSVTVSGAFFSGLTADDSQRVRRMLCH